MRERIEISISASVQFDPGWLENTIDKLQNGTPRERGKTAMLFSDVWSCYFGDISKAVPALVHALFDEESPDAETYSYRVLHEMIEAGKLDFKTLEKAVKETYARMTTKEKNKIEVIKNAMESVTSLFQTMRYSKKSSRSSGIMLTDKPKAPVGAKGRIVRTMRKVNAR